MPTIWADATLLRLALTNLVDNATQSMPNGGVVVISVAKDASDGREAIRIDVSDRGQGMDSHTLHRALDPFFSTRPSGTGLGLPIAGRILEAHSQWFLGPQARDLIAYLLLFVLLAWRPKWLTTQHG